MSEDALELAQMIVDVLEAKKGENILLLDLIGVCSFTDYFVICTGGSERTLKALAEEARLQIKDTYKQLHSHIEGEAQSGWILMDLGDVILHIFSPNLREYYRLEDLWREGRVLLHMQ
jgi:ribosome-associated protein